MTAHTASQSTAKSFSLPIAEILLTSPRVRLPGSHDWRSLQRSSPSSCSFIPAVFSGGIFAVPLQDHVWDLEISLEVLTHYLGTLCGPTYEEGGQLKYVRCNAHSNGIGRRNRSRVNSGGCHPMRMDSIRSGARKLNRSTRMTYRRSSCSR
jgi:hypothetical protein